MSKTDLLALSPILILTLTTLVVMLTTAFKRDHALAFGISLAGQVFALLSFLWVSAAAPRTVTTLLVIDGFGLFYMGLVLIASIGVTILSYNYFEKQVGYQDEYYMLLLMATIGAIVLVASSHFVSLFVGLELLTISLYAMVAYTRTTIRSIEAGLKYLVLASVSTAFLLFGIALIYAELGTMQFGLILDAAKTGQYREIVLLAGAGLVSIAVGFKLAVVPFHMWTPDVYEGAPAPATAYVATVSKGAMTAVLLRLYIESGMNVPAGLLTAFSILAVLSMLLGNLLALMQENVKRILAYSSIAHLGYLLVAFLAGGQYAAEAATYYLVAYMVTSLGTFGVVAVLSGKGREAENIEDFRGLFWRRPLVAGLFTAMLLSLAGIPMTAGFIGKFYLLAAGVDMKAWGLLSVLVVSSAIGLFYYLRIVASMYQSTEEGAALPALPTPAALGSVTLAVIAAAVIWLGVYPVAVINLIRSAVSSLL